MIVLLSLLAMAFAPQNVGRIGRGVPQAVVSGLPLLHQASFTDTGAFRLPQGSPATGCGEDLQFGGGTIAYNPAGNSGNGSILLTVHSGNVAEVSIPAAVNSATLSNLNTAVCTQASTEITEGYRAHANLSASDSSAFGWLAGMTVLSGKLWATMGVFYDANAAQQLFLLSRPLTLSTTGQVTGLYGVSSTASGFINQMAMQGISPISSDWTTAMGGDAFVYKFAGNVVTSMSYGPAATVISTSAFTNANSVQKTTISTANSDSSFNDSGSGFPSLSAGNQIGFFDSTNPFSANNKLWTVVSATSSKIVVSGSVTTASAGNTIAIGRVYTAAHTPLYATAARGPSGACLTSNGDNVLSTVAGECNDGVRAGWPGGTFGSVYKYWSSADYDGTVIQPKGTRTLIVAHVHGAGHSTYGGYGYGCGCASAPVAPNTGHADNDCGGVDTSGSVPGDHCAGEGYYYDPEHSTDKGNHGFPYDYQFVLYDMNDLVAAIAGSKDPRDIVPYEYFNWTFPVMPNTSGDQTRMATTYDPTNQIIYLAQQHGPDNTYALIHKITVTP